MQTSVPAPVHLDKVLKGLARNPALPSALVRRLLRHRAACHEAAMWRTDLTARLAEEIMAVGDSMLTHSLACNRNLPLGVRLRLAGSPDAAVRTAVAIRAHGLPEDVYAGFVTDPSPQVRKYIAGDDQTPPGLRAGLARDPDPEVRAHLAQWWNDAPEHVRRTLLTDTDPTVRAAACSTYFCRLPHPVPPADLHARLLADPVTRAGVVTYLGLDAATARELATDQDPKVRRAVARHPELPPELLDALHQDQDPGVRAEIFAREDTAEDMRAVIHTALRTGADRFHSALATTPDLNEQDLSCYIALADLDHRTIDWVMADPLVHIESPYVCFRRSVARSGSLPAWATTKLLNDPNGSVRETMARRIPDLDPATAERIERLHTENPKHRGRPTEHITFPAETLHRFATDPEPKMRILAFRDAELPAALAQQLATDDNDRVRREAAAHPSLPTTALLALLADPTARVAETAGRSPALPLAAMEHLVFLAAL